MTVASHTDRTADLTWTASTDNIGVSEYEIYYGSLLTGSSATTSYTVTGLTPSTTYTFTVKAKDAENNVSAASNAVSVTMDESYTLIHVEKTTNALTIDGTLDVSVWNMQKQVSMAVIGTPDNTTEFGVLWDDNNLYVGVKVIDGDLYNNSTQPL